MTPRVLLDKREHMLEPLAQVAEMAADRGYEWYAGI